LSFRIRPYDPATDRDLVLGWLIEAVAIGIDCPVDASHQKQHYFPELNRTQARDPRFVSMAMSGGRAVGLVDAFPMPPNPRKAFMRFLYVLPKLRGAGIADRLVTYSDGLLGGMGCREILLDVRAGNARAVAFYRRHGWGLRNQREGGFLRMRREIPVKARRPASADRQDRKT